MAFFGPHIDYMSYRCKSYELMKRSGDVLILCMH